MKNALIILLLVLAILAVRQWENRPLVHAPGVLVPEAPRQLSLAAPQALHSGQYTLTPRAAFQLRARVLSRENYRWDNGADLSPVDLALGWGVMSDQAVLDRIDVTQGFRWYRTRYEYPAPISDQEIIRHSSNMHMIPANDWVRDRLGDVRTGDIVQLRGKLVDVDRTDGFRWRTSMTRDDTGNGSCELFYLEQIYIEPRG